MFIYLHCFIQELHNLVTSIYIHFYYHQPIWLYSYKVRSVQVIAINFLDPCCHIVFINNLILIPQNTDNILFFKNKIKSIQQKKRILKPFLYIILPMDEDKAPCPLGYSTDLGRFTKHTRPFFFNHAVVQNQIFF